MSKDAREIARLYYQQHHRDLHADSYDLSLNPRAVHIWLPQLVVMMKPVCIDDADNYLPLSHSPVDADSWYIHLMVGDVQLAHSLAFSLEPLPLFCFQRSHRGVRMHRRQWDRLLKRKKIINIY